jgi:shikimate dehydrogenase
VTREENRNLLRQNGKLIHLDRPPEALATDGDRPLSQTPEALAALYRARAPLYAAWRDLRIGSTSPEEAAERILEALT